MFPESGRIPVALDIAAANLHDGLALTALLGARLTRPPARTEQPLRLDNGSDYRDTRQIVVRRRHVPHIL